MEKFIRYNSDPANNVYAMFDQDHNLVGYCSYGRDAQVSGGDYSQAALDIGMMIKPELTGHGLGTTFTGDVIRNGIEKYAPHRLRVTIAAFNMRARRVWKKHGFKLTRAFKRSSDGMEFVIMTLTTEGNMSDSALQALSILRDGSQFEWYVIPLLAFVFYVYVVEAEKRNWSLVLAGLAFWGMDWFNEIVNGIVLRVTGYAPIWGAPADTAYLIFVGLNIEIMFMFAVSGVIWTKMLLPSKEDKILGMPNRWAVAVGGSAFCVFVEYLLNSAGALTWDWPWWNRSAPWLIFLFGYLTFFIVAFWVYDMESFKQKLWTVGTIWGVDLVLVILFAGVLRWI